MGGPDMAPHTPLRSERLQRWSAEAWGIIRPEPMIDGAPGPTSHTYFSQRLRLHYVDWGNAGKPPLLLIHGGRDHCRNWDWTAAALRN